jgi:hypothetical protein
VRVWGNTIREDGQAWADTGRHVSRVLREHTDDSGGPGPFVSRRLPAGPATATRPSGSSGSPGRTRLASPPAGAPGSSTAAAASSRPSVPPPSPTRLGGGRPRRPASSAPDSSGPLFPGGGGARSARDEARTRFQELMRRTAPNAERLRQERARQSEDGEDE